MLDDVALVCADAPRARCYMQAFAARGLLPSSCLILPDEKPSESKIKREPLEAPWGWFDADRGVKDICAETDVPCDDAPCHDINAPENVRRIGAMSQSVCIYAGFGGVILRAELLGAGKKFMHAHGGWLPEYKGSTTNYYSALRAGFCAASVMFLNAGIDQGEILYRRRFAKPADMSLIDHGHDNIFRAEALCDVLAMRVKTGRWPDPVTVNEPTNPYFVMHPLLRHMAILGREGVDW